MRKQGERTVGPATRRLVIAVKEHMKKRGVGGRRAAADVGLPEDAFRSLIKGHRPTLDRADEVCRALRITMKLGREDDEG